MMTTKNKLKKAEVQHIRFQGVASWLHPETAAAARRVLEARGNRWVFAFTRGERAVFRCRKPIPVSDWAERHRVLHLSSRPGRWHNEVTPYTAGIMNASFFPSVREVVIMKCPQSGGTEAVHNCIGYAVDRAPGPVLYVYPDETTAKENATDRVIPMLNASPRLREYMTGVADDLSALRIRLAHMSIHMAWSGSASRLGNKPIRYLVLDELDKYQHSKRETSSEALAEKRVITWGRKARIWKISTPTAEGMGIHRAYTEAEARYAYYVICPHCGAELLMDFDQMSWPESVTDPVQIQSRQLGSYVCQHCTVHWSDTDRDKAVRMGIWRHEGSGMTLSEHLEAIQPMSVGFHLPAWLSPFVSLSEIASVALQCSLPAADLLLVRDLCNNYKAEPWIEAFEVRKEDAILLLCDDRPRGVVPGPELLPNGSKRSRVACLLATVDTQKRYFRYVIRAHGFGAEEESWLIQEGVAPTLKALEEIFWHAEYCDAEGTIYPVRAVMIDAMGDPERTWEVINWAVKDRVRILPSQGVHAPSAPVTFTPWEYFPGEKGQRVKIPGGLLLHRVDTTSFKGKLAQKLSINPDDPGAFHLHANDDNVLALYAKEMCAEVWDAEKRIWDNPKRRPNHVWDCEYLQQALAWVMGVARMKHPEEQRNQRPIRANPLRETSNTPQSIADRLSRIRR